MLTEMKMSIQWLFYVSGGVGVHNFTKIGHISILDREHGYTGVYLVFCLHLYSLLLQGLLIILLCFVAIWENLNLVSIFILIHLILNKLAWMFVSACHGNYMLTSRALQFCSSLHLYCDLSYFPFEGWQLMSILSCHPRHGAGELLSFSFRYSFCRRFPVAAVITWVGYSSL